MTAARNVHTTAILPFACNIIMIMIMMVVMLMILMLEMMKMLRMATILPLLQHSQRVLKSFKVQTDIHRWYFDNLSIHVFQVSFKIGFTLIVEESLQ